MIMKLWTPFLRMNIAILLIACFSTPVYADADLDRLYGILIQPNYIKHFEADAKGKVLLNPYLQVASKEHPALLDAKGGPYSWTIDEKGEVALVEEVAHPYGYTYKHIWLRPEDKTQRKPGPETYGHVSATGGGPGRISGEILYDKKNQIWIINNKSGRYSRLNPDRTPEKLIHAAKLIRSVVNPGALAWGPVIYLLEYGPMEVADELKKSPDLKYEEDNPTIKARPYVELK